MKKSNNYSCASCSFECPNSVFDECDFAADLNYEWIRCNNCWFNTGTCDTCLWLGNEFLLCDSCILKEVN